MKIYLIRHAADEPGFRGGWSQTGLSQLGRDQARKLAARIAAEQQGWREINNGDLAGIPNDVARKQYPGLFFNSLEMDERYPSGESPRELLNRVTLAWAALTDNVAIVTHGGVISVLYRILLKVEWPNKKRQFPAGNTSVHTVELYDGCWGLTHRNDMEHLEADTV